MKFKGTIFLFSVTLFLLSFSGISAQDPGLRDTCRIECVQTVPPSSKIAMKVYISIDQALGGFTIPLTFYNVNNLDIYVDSIIWTSWVTAKPPSVEARNWHNSALGDTAKTLLIGGVWIGGGLHKGSGLLATVWFHTGANWNSSLYTKVDTTIFYPPETGVPFQFVDSATATGYYPEFVPGCLGPPPTPHKPILTAPANVTVNAGDIVNFLVIATDQDPTDTLTIVKSGVGSFTTTPHPSPDTGFFSWATTDLDTLNSPYLDTFIVDDGTGLKDTSIVQIIVRPFYHNPRLLLPAPSFTIFAGDSIAFEVKATDPDPTDILTIIKRGVGNFTHSPSVSPTTGYFSWATVLGDTLHSPYTDSFIVDDGTGLSDTGIVVFNVVMPETLFLYGDMDGNGLLQLADAVYLLNYLFANGPPPDPLASGDVNNDCYITIADVIFLSNYFIKPGSPAPKPWCLPGDVKHDGYVNLPDIVYFINYLLLSGRTPKSLNSTDVSGNCVIDIVDLVYLINFLFRGGPLPVPGCVEPDPLLLAKVSTAPALVKVADISRDQGSGIIEIPVSASFSVPLAGVQIEVGFDPFLVEALPPLLSTRTSSVPLYHSTKFDRQVIGLVDVSLANLIQPGDGTLLTLRFKPRGGSFDLSSIKVREIRLVDTNAIELPTRIEK